MNPGGIYGTKCGAPLSLAINVGGIGGCVMKCGNILGLAAIVPAVSLCGAGAVLGLWPCVSAERRIMSILFCDLTLRRVLDNLLDLRLCHHILIRS